MFLGIYDYTVWLTYSNLLIGFLGIFITVNEPSRINNLNYAAICLLLAGICDYFDGIVSNFKKTRTLKEKKYGVQIDSLVDIVSFGLLPVLIGWSLFKPYLAENRMCYLLFYVIAGAYLLTALIRLAFFNVSKEEYLNSEKTPNERPHVQMFTGVPVTCAALFFPFVILINKILSQSQLNEPIPFLYILCLFIFSFLFIFDKIKFKKLKNLIVVMFLLSASVILILKLLI
ncbi:CDP-alcohol phosphatidyltransferase family protein ['Camptotheca acuminata' phytoplasma]|uniref:CDP-alcohol phosphatidyltransferase family protein n=1 Tax='Camptotheca acuminata' phytoplasma TaxID=3239192 RepID=UPI003519F1AD